MSRVLLRHVGIRVGVIVGNRLQIVRPRKESAKLAIDPSIVFRETEKFSLDALVALEHAACDFEDAGLGGVKAGQVGRSPGRVSQSNAKHGVGFGQKRVRLLQKPGRLRGHTSTPSRRISYMSGVSLR